MLIKTTYYVDGDITDLDIEMLINDGIKGLILDLDSTVMAPKAGSLTDEASAWLERARAHFQMLILSNNKEQEYLDLAQTILAMPVIGCAAKPSPAGFKKSLTLLNLSACEAAVVGDRALTDILGGNMSNIKTVLVRPLKSIVEPGWKTYVRNLERSLVRR
ncbi:MAG: YqeG family HAD IIIA-type phosphatase [Candidatus Obscuribacterales bacterium]|nr:YqeG family HAD IIIA-type phosphatase [Candidatus Obscuribacterales bacterium]